MRVEASRTSRAPLVWALRALVLSVFSGAVLAPLGAVLWRGRSSGLLLDPVILRVAARTAEQAAVSAGLSAALGLPLGLLVAAQGARASRWQRALLAVPFGVPTVVASSAWVLWLGRSGWLARAGLPLDLLYRYSAVVLAHVFFNAPWIALLVAQARLRMPGAWDDAADSLGAPAVTRFLRIEWPFVRGAFAGATLQTLSFCSMSFAIVLLLGGGPPVETLETALYARIRFGAVDFPGAAACAFWELALTLGPWALLAYLSRGRRGEEVSRGGGAERESSRRAAQAWVHGLGWACAAAFVVPYAGLLLGVLFSGEPSSLATLAGGAPEWIGALALSLKLAAAVAAATVAFSAVSAAAFAGTAIEGLLLLPSGVSALALGLGFWTLYGGRVDFLAGAWGWIALLEAALFAPIALRLLLPVARSPRREHWEAAESLGAGISRILLRVEWPRWRRPLLAAAALVASASLGEVSIVSLLYSERTVTLPLLVSRWLGQYRFDSAQALSALLLVVSAAATLGVWAGGVE